MKTVIWLTDMQKNIFFCQLLQKKKSVLLFLSIWSLPHVGRVTPASAPASWERFNLYNSYLWRSRRTLMREEEWWWLAGCGRTGGRRSFHKPPPTRWHISLARDQRWGFIKENKKSKKTRKQPFHQESDQEETKNRKKTQYLMNTL